MDELKEENSQKNCFNIDDYEPSSKKRKGRWVCYLPALFTSLITIALLLLIIIGSIFSGAATNTPQTRFLHEIDFTVESASFNEEYSYVVVDEENPEIIVNQGLRWETLESIIRVVVPEYNDSVSLKMNYGGFNAKHFETVPEPGTPQYKICGYNQSNELIITKNYSSVNSNDEITVPLQSIGITYLDIKFQSPVTIVGTGYLYVEKMAVSEVRN